jgi:hypothetical protein|tara:strand:+ start:1195 stop:1575 length:381 start_codon:yes stop_codon:yes gene_type:complete
VHKRKILTEKDKISLKVKHKEYNKRLRTQYMHKSQLTFEDFVDYLHGYYKKTIKTKPLKSYKIPTLRKEEIIPSMSSFKESSTGLDWKKHKEKLEISKNYTIVPAYNKGPYMVVPVHELHTAGRKV